MQQPSIDDTAPSDGCLSFELTSATPLLALRTYASIPAADDPCPECHGTGQVERNIDGCDVMVKCVMCSPQLPRLQPRIYRSRPRRFIDADDRFGWEVGVPSRGEI